MSMANAVVQHKINVFNLIAELPADEKQRAEKLYPLFDAVQWLSVAPLIFAMFFLLTAPFILKLAKIDLENGSNVTALLALGVTALTYVAGIFILKALIFNPWRSAKLEKIRKLLMTDHHYRVTLATLEDFDPGIERWTRNILPAATS
jgi:hypothetical protein